MSKCYFNFSKYLITGSVHSYQKHGAYFNDVIETEYFLTCFICKKFIIVPRSKIHNYGLVGEFKPNKIRLFIRKILKKKYKTYTQFRYWKYF